MVERYTQGALPSPVVGTPGVAPAAGKAAEEVSKLSTEAVNEAFQNQRATEQSLTKIGNDALYYGGYLGREIAHKHAQAQVQTAQLKSAQNEMDLNSQVAGIATQATHDSMSNPQNAPQLFKDNLKQAIADLPNAVDPKTGQPKYGQDKLSQLILKNDTLHMVTMGNAHFNNLTAAIQPRLNAQIDLGFKQILPNAESQQSNTDINSPVASIANMTSTLTQQSLVSVDKLLKQSQDEGLGEKVAELQGQRRGLAEKIGEGGVNVMRLGIGPDADGVNRGNDIIKLLQMPEQPSGITLSPETRLKLIGGIHEDVNRFTTQGVELVKQQGGIESATINNDLLYPLSKAEDYADHSQQVVLQGKIDTKMNDIKNRLSDAEKMRDGPIKLQTIMQLKQQQGQLLGGTRYLQTEADRYESKAFRNMRWAFSQDQANINNKLAELGIQIQLSNQQYNQGENRNRLLGAVQESNFINRRNQVASMDAGPERKVAADQLSRDVIEHTTWAVQNGIMNGEEAAKFQQSFGKSVVQAALYKDKGFLHLGPRYVPLQQQTPTQKAAAEQQTSAVQVELFKGMGNDGNRLTALVKKQNTLPDIDKLALQEHITRNYLSDLDKARTAPKNPLQKADEDRWTQAYYAKRLGEAGKGLLPEQLLEQKLRLRQSRPQPTAPVEGQSSSAEIKKEKKERGDRSKNPPARPGISSSPGLPGEMKISPAKAPKGMDEPPEG